MILSLAFSIGPSYVPQL